MPASTVGEGKGRAVRLTGTIAVLRLSWQSANPHLTAVAAFAFSAAKGVLDAVALGCGVPPRPGSAFAAQRCERRPDGASCRGEEVLTVDLGRVKATVQVVLLVLLPATDEPTLYTSVFLEVVGENGNVLGQWSVANASPQGAVEATICASLERLEEGGWSVTPLGGASPAARFTGILQQLAKKRKSKDDVACRDSTCRRPVVTLLPAPSPTAEPAMPPLSATIEPTSDCGHDFEAPLPPHQATASESPEAVSSPPDWQPPPTPSGVPLAQRTAADGSGPSIALCSGFPPVVATTVAVTAISEGTGDGCAPSSVARTAPEEEDGAAEEAVRLTVGAPPTPVVEWGPAATGDPEAEKAATLVDVGEDHSATIHLDQLQGVAQNSMLALRVLREYCDVSTQESAQACVTLMQDLHSSCTAWGQSLDRDMHRLEQLTAAVGRLLVTESVVLDRAQHVQQLDDDLRWVAADWLDARTPIPCGMEVVTERCHVFPETHPMSVAAVVEQFGSDLLRIFRHYCLTAATHTAPRPSAGRLARVLKAEVTSSVPPNLAVLVANSGPLHMHLPQFTRLLAATGIPFTGSAAPLWVDCLSHSGLPAATAASPAGFEEFFFLLRAVAAEVYIAHTDLVSLDHTFTLLIRNFLLPHWHTVVRPHLPFR
eukprot:GGOE01037660.1.p1 GENE.GGOE01037660.1~~GGOE01037660.1.p1  ORF type:complete len:655 (-),score=116.01 GGOE01037660.1:7-1971(-)